MSLRLVLLFVVAHGLAGYAFLKDVGPGFPLDDTWLHMVYAQSFGEGRGFAFNPGQPETGITAPIWTAMLSVPVVLSQLASEHQGLLKLLPWTGDLPFDGRPDFLVRMLGGLMGLLTALAGYRLTSGAGRWPAAFTAVVLTFDATLLFDRFAGMEIPLFSLGTMLYIGALLDGRVGRSGLLAGLLALIRPEGLLLSVLGAGWFAKRKLSVTRFLGVVALCILPWMTYCFILSGRPWPATFDAKAAMVLEPRMLFASVGALLNDSGWGWALPLASLVGIFSLEGGRHSLGVLTAAAAGLLLGGVLLSRPMQIAGETDVIPYYWARYTHIAWPLLLIMGATGLSALTRTAYAGLRCRPHYALLLIAPFLVLSWFGRDLFAHGSGMSARFADQCDHVERQNVAAGYWIADHTPKRSVVATHDAGAIRFFGKRKVVDIFGHQNFKLLAAERAGPELARHWLLDTKPDVLAVFPALWARNHSPELKQIWAQQSPQDGAQLMMASDDYAEFFGLTQRVKTFHVEHPSTVPSPLHADLAIFVAP